MVFSGDFPGRVFTENRVPGAPFKGIKTVKGAPPGAKIQSGHVKSFSGLLINFKAWRRTKETTPNPKTTKFHGRQTRFKIVTSLSNHLSEKSSFPYNFLPAILGPEMAAPILWAPGKMRSFCRKSHVHKIPRFRGGGVFGFFFGGGSAGFYFYGRGDFSELSAATNFW